MFHNIHIYKTKYDFSNFYVTYSLVLTKMLLHSLLTYLLKDLS